MFELMADNQERAETVDALVHKYRPHTAPSQPKARAPRGSKPAKETADKDQSGGRPIPGKSYTINGTTWQKSATGKGRAKDIFIDAIKGGLTWVEMEVKQ